MEVKISTQKINQKPSNAIKKISGQTVNLEHVARHIEKKKAPVSIEVRPAEKDLALKRDKSETTLGNAIADQFPWTTDTIAEELEMPLASFRAWKMKAEQAGKISKPKVGSLFCIVDPVVKTRHRFSDAYLDKLKEARGSVVSRKKEVAASSLQHAKLKMLVPIFDSVVANFLTKKFGDERAIEEYLKDHLLGLAKPALNKIEELKKRFEAEMAELMGK